VAQPAVIISKTDAPPSKVRALALIVFIVFPSPLGRKHLSALVTFSNSAAIFAAGLSALIYQFVNLLPLARHIPAKGHFLHDCNAKQAIADSGIK
jgi:hypothetical protein